MSLNCSKRRFLAGAVATLVGGMSMSRMAHSRPRLKNACFADVPDDAEVQTLIEAAWDGIDPALVWDMHVHLAGVGDSDSGIVISDEMHSLWHPLQYAQRLFLMNAGCANNAEGKVDKSYVARLANLTDAMPAGFKLLLLAFDCPFDETGQALKKRSSLYIPNSYAMRVAHANPARFEWACSIHPLREDCVDALYAAVENGARAVKWLPPAMGIDPASPRCDAFYAALAKIGLPLITHIGAEKAVHGPGHEEWSNPLRMRRALEQGVRVVMAHCGTAGENIDTDQDIPGGKVPTFDLFTRLMDESRYEGLLYGDISATVLTNRPIEVIQTLLERQAWHSRLLFGSDYPLPGIVPLVGLNRLVRARLLNKRHVAGLKRIRHHNPILFDFVLKRHLQSRGRSFAPSVFENRTVFDLPSVVQDFAKSKP